jgi:hypothetical protein
MTPLQDDRRYIQAGHNYALWGLLRLACLMPVPATV